MIPYFQMADALKLYDELGFCPIPLRARDKRPALTTWGAYKTRRSLPEEWSMWWPNTNGLTENNIGIATGTQLDTVTGESNHLIVLDFDNEPAYELAMTYVPDLLGTMTVKTGRGWHVYIRPDRPPGATFTLKADGIEGVHHVKADGGYVVAPPSIHPSGSRYELDGELPLQTFSVEWLVRALMGAGFTRASVEPAARPEGWWDTFVTETYGEGGRNDALVKLVGILHNAIGSPTLALELARGWNATHCVPPLPDREVLGVVRSCQRYARHFDSL